MSTNKLKLNAEKTECVVVGPKSRRLESGLTTLVIGDTEVPVSEIVKDLGVILDSDLSTDSHISQITKMCFLQLRNISNIRKYLTKESAIILILSLVMTRIDFCNSLLVGASAVQINRLQRVQKSLARKQDHITPTLKDLHWLPVQHRVTFKILCLAHRCLSGDTPGYLQDLLPIYSPTRSLRSESKLLCRIPNIKTVRYGQRSFSYAVTSAWNSLPESIRRSLNLMSFRRQLKTYLFQQL
ncbi:uncharacterized protein LOC124287151 [Haliotis rubra]|uniref:uncharacterized protein LOC124287151 n=1 Tax=Haliotis rubra TaxID=36100 RepID=UPI001EE4FFDE|nr:uncharacterized protein LOC124287151 [Haliotis rubra]